MKVNVKVPINPQNDIYCGDCDRLVDEDYLSRYTMYCSLFSKNVGWMTDKKGDYHKARLEACKKGECE